MEFETDTGDGDHLIRRTAETFSHLTQQVVEDDDPLVGFAFVGIHASGAVTRSSVQTVASSRVLLMAVSDYLLEMAGMERRN